MRLIQEVLALAGLVVQMVLVGSYWHVLPRQVPMHFDARGAVDAYGDKSTLLILAGVTAGLYVLLTVVSFFPQYFNYPAKVTPENRGRMQGIATAMIGWMKAEFTWLFSYIVWVTIRVAMGRASGLGWAFLPVMLAVIGVTVVRGVVRMRQAA